MLESIEDLDSGLLNAKPKLKVNVISIIFFISAVYIAKMRQVKALQLNKTVNRAWCV